MAQEVLLTSAKSKTKEWFDEEGKVVIQVTNEAQPSFLVRPTRRNKNWTVRINKNTALAGERRGLI